MGGGGSKGSPSGTTALEYGTFKINGTQLYAEGVIVLTSGELQIGNSPDTTFRISSKEHGRFDIKAKYMGATLKESLEFSHEELITLLQDSESSDTYQALQKKFEYKRNGTKLAMGRAFSFDITKLLPYLYECFAKQNLSDHGERLVQEKQLGRLNSQKKKQNNNPKQEQGSQKQKHPPVDDEMAKYVKDLEQLERSMSKKSTKARKK